MMGVGIRRFLWKEDCNFYLNILWGIIGTEEIKITRFICESNLSALMFSKRILVIEIFVKEDILCMCRDNRGGPILDLPRR